jgi:hypothetical protein
MAGGQPVLGRGRIDLSGLLGGCWVALVVPGIVRVQPTSMMSGSLRWAPPGRVVAGDASKIAGIRRGPELLLCDLPESVAAVDRDGALTASVGLVDDRQVEDLPGFEEAGSLSQDVGV